MLKISDVLSKSINAVLSNRLYGKVSAYMCLFLVMINFYINSRLNNFVFSQATPGYNYCRHWVIADFPNNCVILIYRKWSIIYFMLSSRDTMEWSVKINNASNPGLQSLQVFNLWPYCTSCSPSHFKCASHEVKSRCHIITVLNVGATIWNHSSKHGVINHPNQSSLGTDMARSLEARLFNFLWFCAGHFVSRCIVLIV